MFGQEWQNPDRVEINSKCRVDFSDFTPYFLAAEWSLEYESWSVLIDGKFDTGIFSCGFMNFGFWRAENERRRRRKKSKCKCIECRRQSIFQLCLLLRKLGCVWAATWHCPFLPQTELFLIKFTQALLLKFFIHFSQEKRYHSYLSKRVSDSLDIFHYKLLAPLLPTDQVTFLIPLLSSTKNGLFHY